MGISGNCIVCGSSAVEVFLDLGTTTLANKFLTGDQLAREELRFPLRVGFCHGCGHVQLTERVPPDAMFEDYLYVSAASDTLRAHFDDLAQTLIERQGLTSDDLVMDIGCNDGSLLGRFRARGPRTLGVDPARNLAELASHDGIERYTGFFGADTAPEIVAKWGQAKLITATNTFAHIPDLDGFVRGIEIALAPGGAFVVEAHYLVDLLEKLAFDTIYHEHVSYWALGPMIRLFEQHGLKVRRAERLPTHHGQLRVTVEHASDWQPHPSVAEMLKHEAELGIDRLETHRAFSQRFIGIGNDLLAKLRELKGAGKRLAGYGAPAKASTLLEYLGIGPETVDFIADRSLLKQGRYTPGTHIPVVAPERLMVDQPDYVLLLAWNFIDEILAQQASYRERGGRFIVPLPKVQVI